MLQNIAMESEHNTKHFYNDIKLNFKQNFYVKQFLTYGEHVETYLF